MRFFEVVISGAALIAAAFAVEFNDVPSSIEPGKTYTITYSPKDNTPTEIILRQGDPNDLDTIATLTTTATGGSFQWTVDTALPDSSNYALEIRQDGSDPNYSGLIALSGSSAVSSAASSAASSATPSASSAASSDASSAASTLITSASSSGTAASASATISSASRNGTVTSATLSATSTSAKSSATGAEASSTGVPTESTGGAAALGSSPLALIFGAVAAMAYLN